MEPNPIYWLELRQLRRSPFPYVFFLAGLAMCGFLFRLGTGPDAVDVLWETPLFWIPVVFHVLVLFGVPFTRASRFVSQQISESELLQTPIDRPRIFFGKLTTGFTLVVLACLPVVPGVALLVKQNRWHYPVLFWLFFLGSLCAVSVFLGFMAGVKSTAGVLGRIFLLLVFLVSGFFVYVICSAVVAILLYSLDSPPFVNEPVFVAVSGTAFLLYAGILATWTGSVLYDKNRNAAPLFCFLLISGAALYVSLLCIIAAYAGGAPELLLVLVALPVAGFFGSLLLTIPMVGD